MADQYSDLPGDIRQLLARGAHLVRCGADKGAFDKRWQETPWTGVGSFVHVGHIPGRFGYGVVDVDCGPEGPASIPSRVAQVLDAMGEPAFSVDTPSGGKHLYYRVNGDGVIPDGKLVVGDLRGDRGQVILWPGAAEKLLAVERTPAMARAEFMERIQPLLKVKAKGCAKGRGRVVGDVERIAAAPRGERNDTAAGLAWKGGATGMDVEAMVAAARAASPDEPDKAERTVRSQHARGAALRPVRPVLRVEAGSRIEVSGMEYAAAMEEALGGVPRVVERRPAAPYEGEAPEPPPKVIQSQTDMADLLFKHFGKRLLYVHPLPGYGETDALVTGRFRWWDKGWKPAPWLRSKVARLGQEHLRTEAVRRTAEGDKRFWKALPAKGGSADFSSGAMKLLAARQGVGVYVSQVDAVPTRVGAPEGRALRLDGGVVADDVKEDLTMRQCAVLPDQGWREKPWYAGLCRRLPDSAVRMRWLIEVARCLFGVRTSKRATFNVGPPNGWKSTYLNVVRRALGWAHEGGYAGVMPSAYMVEGAKDMTAHKLDSAMAKLVGARVAIYDETPVDSNGKPLPWSSRFVGDLTSDDSGISYREIGGKQGYLHGLSVLAACNEMPSMPVYLPAVIARLILFPWENTERNREEYEYLATQAAAAECLGALLDHAPLALLVHDGVPVPPTCGRMLDDYALRCVVGDE